MKIKIDFCKKCKDKYNKDYEMIINHNEGFMSCTKCGNMEYVIIVMSSKRQLHFQGIVNLY